MASKERPTLHLKKNPDFPPQPPKQEEGFDTRAAASEANEYLIRAREELEGSGLTIPQVSESWSKLRDINEGIHASLDQYKLSKDKIERAALHEKIKTETARLQEFARDNLSRAEQNEIIKRQKEKDETYVPNEHVPNQVLEEKLKAYTRGEAEAFSSPLEEELAQKRARLDELEAQEKGSVGVANSDTASNVRSKREIEFLKTEDEVRALEKKLNLLRSTPVDDEEPLTHGETVSKLKKSIANYAGEAHYPVPAVIETSSEDDLKPRSRGASQTPEVIHLPDQSVPTASVEDEPVSTPEEPVQWKNMPTDFGVNEARATERAEMLSDPEKLEAGILELARKSRGEEAAQVFAYPRKRVRFEQTTPETYLRQGKLVLTMLEEEKAYLDAYKEHKKKQGFLVTAADKFVNVDKMMPPQIKALKQRWIQSRGEYLAMRNQSVEKKLDTIKNPNLRDAVQTKYEVLFGKSIINAAILDAEKAEQNARAEGLDERSKASLERLYDKYQKLPSYIRIPATFGVITAVSAGATAATVGALPGLAALALAGGVTAVRAALGVIGERSNNPKVKRVIEIFSNFTSVGTWGKFIGEKGVKGLHELLGTEKKADATLAEKYSLRNLGNEKSNERMLKNREKALETHEEVERQAELAGAALGTAAAVTGGFGFGHWVRGFFGGNAEAAPTPEHAHAEVAVVAAQAPTAEELADQAKDHLKESIEEAAKRHAHAVAHPNQHAHGPRADAREEVAAGTPGVPLGGLSAEESDISMLQRWEVQNHGFQPNTDPHIHDAIDRIHHDPSSHAFDGAHYSNTAGHEAPPPAHATPPAPAPETQHQQPASPETAHAHPSGPDRTEIFPSHDHSFMINPKEPGAYSYLDHGKEVFQIYGGTGTEGQYAAQQYVLKYPDAVARFEAWHTDSVTGAITHYTGAMGNLNGQVVPVTTGNFPAPNPDVFAKKLDFAFKK
jgi:hypothetical protein